MCGVFARLGLAALAIVVPAGAARPVDEPSGRIVFESGHDTPEDGVHVLNADGTGERQIAAPLYVGPSVLEAARPEPSPRGDRVAFVRHAFATDPATSTRRISTIAVASLDGRARVRSLGRGDFPGWSPDGRRIAFKRLGWLYVADSNGRRARRLARVDRGSFRRYVPGGDRVDLVPAWSPDGTRIAFARGGEIWIATVDGRRVRRLTQSGEPDAAPAWSPDGRRLAWICGNDVCAARRDGRARPRLSFAGDAQVAVVHWSPVRVRPQLAFVAVGRDLESYSLYATSPALAQPRLVVAYARTGHPDFAWSSDGRFFAISFQRLIESPREYRQQLAVVPLAGGAPRPLTTRSAWRPRWTVDT